tara:strand:- start:139 stop:429 length:291 start_codon:yes stop_codon:yes gene_type:complete
MDTFPFIFASGNPFLLVITITLVLFAIFLLVHNIMEIRREKDHLKRKEQQGPQDLSADYLSEIAHNTSVVKWFIFVWVFLSFISFVWYFFTVLNGG